MELDKWQQDVLNTTGNIALRSGRQVGKSTVISIKAADYAIKNPQKSIMIISATERQAYLLFSKVLGIISDFHRKEIKSGKDRPTKSEIKLKNGSIIRCLPTGMDGLGIRGYTVDLLIADEAAFIPPEVWPAITPMLATTGGVQILLSTPFGNSGYFYERFSDDTFTKFHISSQEVAESRPEPQRSRFVSFIDEEKRHMTTLQFTQEYLGEFVSELRQVYPDPLLKKICCLKRSGLRQGRFYMGVDIARMGDDASVFSIFNVISKEDIQQVEHITTRKTKLTDTEDKIWELNRLYESIIKIYIDAGSGAQGTSVYDHLIINEQTKRKAVSISNQKRVVDRFDESKTKWQKVELYQNLLMLMERGFIKLLDDDEIVFSLKSCQYELSEDKTQLKIIGYPHTDDAEAIVRGAHCVKDIKSDIWFR